MAPIITENRDKIVAACDKHKLKHFYVFGSAARGNDFTDTSDVDFLYAFDSEKIPTGTYVRNYFDFIYTLEKLLGRQVDLIPEKKIRNPFLLKEVNADKIKLYGG